MAFPWFCYKPAAIVAIKLLRTYMTKMKTDLGSRLQFHFHMTGRHSQSVHKQIELAAGTSQSSLFRSAINVSRPMSMRDIFLDRRAQLQRSSGGLNHLNDGLSIWEHLPAFFHIYLLLQQTKERSFIVSVQRMASPQACAAMQMGSRF